MILCEYLLWVYFKKLIVFGLELSYVLWNLNEDLSVVGYVLEFFLISWFNIIKYYWM